ncbi:hypothetical protein EX30DRAFT_341200 [Ascodesmis nigricans]|uniref:Mid2 domain-containing protein n=1 Tax=Ascodesmis nigricans TaxID=341454 RepID=A0A4S2MW88_9PEZI|nr:hypothetical protein EX30DRAFT_341200 [Ascodesmis nigricans]
MPMIVPREAMPKPILVARQNPNDPICYNPEKQFWTCTFEWDPSLPQWIGCCTGNPCQSVDGKCPDPNYRVDQFSTYAPSPTTTASGNSGTSQSTPTSDSSSNNASESSSSNNASDNSSNNGSGDSKSTTTTIAVASSIASVAGVIIIGFIVWFFLRQKKKKARQSLAYAPPPGYMDAAYANPNDAHAAYGVGSAAVPTPTPRDTKRWTFFSKSSRAEDASAAISPVSPMTDKHTANNRMSELHSESMYSPRSDVVAELPEAGSGAR